MHAFTLFLMVLLMKKVPFPSLSGQTCYTLHEVTWKTVKLLKYKGYNIEVILFKVVLLFHSSSLHGVLPL